MKRQVEEFLNRHKLNADEISMDSLCELFLNEMRSGLAGKPSFR